MTAQLEADELGRADRDAALYCLRHSLSRDRVRMAARLMVSSVWTQAAMVGVLGCGHCADAGCWWCQP